MLLELFARGILIFGCPWERECRHLWSYSRIVNTMSYKPLASTSSNLQLWCSWKL